MESADITEHDHLHEFQVAGFIAKTYQILNSQEHSKTIYWGPTGKDFVIKDITKFQQVILPLFFRHSKMNSFVRQLNMYGFHKSRKEHTKSIFSHPNFQKGKPELLKTIKRKIKEQKNCDLKLLRTPTKEKNNELQKIQQTAVKQRTQKKHTLHDIQNPQNLQNFLCSRECLVSRYNLNMNFSLKQISMEQLPQLSLKQDGGHDDDDLVSIELGIQKQEKQEKQKNDMMNPSMFLGSIGEIMRM